MRAVPRQLAGPREALRASLANTDSFSILDVDLDPHDISPAPTDPARAVPSWLLRSECGL